MLPEVTTSLMSAASVQEVLDRRLRVQTADWEGWVTLAVFGGYQPVRGDLVLILRQEEEGYVVGVLHARGPMSIISAGDLNLVAPNGRITLTSPRSTSIRSPRIRLHATQLEITARHLFERCHNMISAVKDLVQLRAGRTRTVVREASHLQAGRIVALAQKDVTVDGESINLG